MTRASCATCRWWDCIDEVRPRPPSVPRGMCHRHPPTTEGARLLPWSFPVTAVDDWCGEHAPAPEEPADG